MSTSEIESKYNFLVYRYNTWGTYGQHTKLIKLIIDIEQKSQKALWEIVDVKWINNDSNKNKHREAYTKLEDVLNMKGKILKEVYDQQSSRKREITVKYYYINDGLKEIKAETGVKIDNKYYDILEINGKKILISKDEVIVQ